MKPQKLNSKYILKRTFWDVDFASLNMKRDRNFIVARLVQWGSDLERLHLHSVFSKAEIYEIISDYRGMPVKIKNFYKIMADEGS